MFCVNLPINTNFFDNNSIKTFTQACNKASETLKSNLVSKYQNLDFENLRKFNDLDLTKSKSDTNLSNTNTSTPNADPSYSVITTTTTPSVISKFINYDKKEMVNGMIENLNIHLKKTKSFVEQKVQILLESLEQPQESLYNKSTAQVTDELYDLSSIEDNNWYDSDEESIFESPAPTSIQLFQDIVNTNPSQEISKDSVSTNSSNQEELQLSTPTELASVNSLASLISVGKLTNNCNICKDYENVKKLSKLQYTPSEESTQSSLSKHEDFEERTEYCDSTASLALSICSESKLIEDSNSNTIEYNYKFNIGTKYNQAILDCSIGIQKYITKYHNFQLSIEQRSSILDGQETQLASIESKDIFEDDKAANFGSELSSEESIEFNHEDYKSQYEPNQHVYEEMKRLKKEYEEQQYSKKAFEQHQYYQQDAEYQKYQQEYENKRLQEERNQVYWKLLQEIFGPTNDHIVGEIEYYWIVDNRFVKISYIDQYVVQFINNYTQSSPNKTQFEQNDNNSEFYNPGIFNVEENINNAFDFNDCGFGFDIDSSFTGQHSPIDQRFEEPLEEYLGNSNCNEITDDDCGSLHMKNQSQDTDKTPNYETIYVSDFFKRVENDLYQMKVSISDTAHYVSEFFYVIEKDQESKELNITKQEVTMDFIWLQIYKILSKKSGNQRLQLFELSQFENNITKKENSMERSPKVSKNSKRKRNIPKNDYKNHPRRSRILHFY